MRYRIGTEKKSTLIVTKEKWGSRGSDTKIMEKMLQPKDLSDKGGKGTVLRFTARLRNSRLLLCTPGNKIGTKVDGIIGGGAVSI